MYFLLSNGLAIVKLVDWLYASNKMKKYFFILVTFCFAGCGSGTTAETPTVVVVATPTPSPTVTTTGGSTSCAVLALRKDGSNYTNRTEETDCTVGAVPMTFGFYSDMTGIKVVNGGSVQNFTYTIATTAPCVITTSLGDKFSSVVLDNEATMRSATYNDSDVTTCTKDSSPDY
jgi:hypothetical protein